MVNAGDEKKGRVMQVQSGYLLTPTGFVRGRLNVNAAGRIEEISGTPVDLASVRDGRQPIILPGFVDLHLHGGAGHDIMQGGDAARHITQLHARHGTTSLLATTMTAPLADVQAALAALGPVCAQRLNGAARVLGVHLEGPYISETRLGAQPPFARPASLQEIEALNALAPIRLITLAPEVDGNLALISELVAQGYKVQLGHTSGSYECGVAALRQGATGFTHLFNAMSPLHHREPGMVGAALAHAQFAEIIPDLLHVHPGAIHAALRAIPGLYCVTDATAATGMPDGEYALGRHKVFKCMGGVRLANGTLAGSTLSMDQALRNLVDKLGLDLRDASRRVSTFAADHLGLQDRGRLQPGSWADLVVLDRDLNLIGVTVEGQALAL